MIDREALINAAEQAYAETPAHRDMGRTARRAAYTTLINALTSAGEEAVPVGCDDGEIDPRIDAAYLAIQQKAPHLITAGFCLSHAYEVAKAVLEANDRTAPHPPRQDGAREVTGYLDRDGKPVDLPADKISPDMVAYFGLTPAAPDEAVSDGRPHGWTEADALALAARREGDLNDWFNLEAFIKMFCEGDWGGIRTEFPDEAEKLDRRARSRRDGGGGV